MSFFKSFFIHLTVTQIVHSRLPFCLSLPQKLHIYTRDVGKCWGKKINKKLIKLSITASKYLKKKSCTWKTTIENNSKFCEKCSAALRLNSTKFWWSLCYMNLFWVTPRGIHWENTQTFAVFFQNFVTAFLWGIQVKIHWTFWTSLNGKHCLIAKFHKPKIDKDQLYF